MVITGATISIGDSMGSFITLFDRKYISKDSPNWKSFLNLLHSNCIASLNFENETVVIVVGYEESHYAKPAETQENHFLKIAQEISKIYELAQERSVRFDAGIKYLNGIEILRNKLNEVGICLED
jgi:hypothetical protein